MGARRAVGPSPVPGPAAHEVAETLRLLGGVARWRELRSSHRRRAIELALGAGLVERAGRGRYVLASVSAQRRRATAATATLSHLSAAVAHGWKVKTVPDAAWVTVRRRRHLRAADLEGLVVHWADLPPADVARGITSPLRTVLDCSRVLPFADALAVADSALRSGDVAPDELRAAAAGLRGKGCRAARTVAEHADARAANPFESALRALTLLEGFDLTPQLQIAEPGLYAVVGPRERGAHAGRRGRRVRAPRHPTGPAPGLPPTHRAGRCSAGPASGSPSRTSWSSRTGPGGRCGPGGW